MTSVFGSFSSRGKKENPPPGDLRPRINGIPVDRLPEYLGETRRGSRRRVTTIGEDVLATKAAPITEFGTPGLRALVDDMFATMAVCHGVGLAAPQVGVGVRLFVFDCRDAYGVRHVGHIINPVLDPGAERAHGKESDEEGCLSVPGPHADVTRARRVTVRGVDVNGVPVEVEGTGMFARCLQHEVDHLDGILYVDRLSARERKKVLAQMVEMQAATWADWDARATTLGKQSSADLDPAPPRLDGGPTGPAEPDPGIVGYDPSAYAPPPEDDATR